jgi:RimJ/RimL family protein N-acetyltransferase
MSWQPAVRGDFSGILGFLMRDEALYVPFTSRLRAASRGWEVYYQGRKEGGVSGCFLFTTGGLLLPALSDSDEDRGELAELLLGLRPMVHSIMGIGSSVRAIEALLPLPPTNRIEYFLMTLPRTSLRPLMPSTLAGLLVRRADPFDAEELFPLQKGYELEEVVITPSHFSDAQCMKLLKTSLREQLVFVVEQDGTLTAKAATNARGYGVDQIGGVYTVPTERGKGLGGLVVAELLRTVFAEKQAACLFVKKHNRPALALYDRLGFTPVNDYVISYYGL